MPQNRVQAIEGGRSAAHRLLIVAGLAMLWMLAVTGRLAYLQLIRHSEYMARAQRQQQRTIEISPKRGAIYDRNMHPLAMSIQVNSAFAVPSEIADPGMVSRLAFAPDSRHLAVANNNGTIYIMRLVPSAN